MRTHVLFAVARRHSKMLLLHVMAFRSTKRTTDQMALLYRSKAKMTATAIAINIIRYIQFFADCEGLDISLSLASERSLACRLPSLLTAVAVLLLSAVVDCRRMPLTLIFDFTMRGSELPAPERREAPPAPEALAEEPFVRPDVAQGSEPLLSQAGAKRNESLASDTCGTDSCVSTMLSIWSTMFCRNLSVVEEVADCDTACRTETSAFSSTTRFVLRHEEKSRDENTSMMARARCLYSRNASKQGQGFEEKSLCP